jgi:hypothetical protein
MRKENLPIASGLHTNGGIGSRKFLIRASISLIVFCYNKNRKMAALMQGE